MKGKKIEYSFNALRRDVMTALPLTRLSGRDFRVLLFILGQTDGYNRSQDKIKPGFFVERTGLDKSNVRVVIARLRKLNMIVKNGQFYTVLPPDQWNKGIFVETQMCIKIDAELPPSGEDNRIKSDAPSASKLMRRELKIDAVLASPIDNSSIDNPTIDNLNAASDVGCGALFSKYKKVISYYRKAYREHTGKPHPFIKAYRRARLIAKLEAFADEKVVLGLKDWKIMIDYHFRRKFRTDWRIYHFATRGVLENLHYKNLY